MSELCQNRKSLNYSITSSARARRLDATERPRASAASPLPATSSKFRRGCFATAVAPRDWFDLSQRRPPLRRAYCRQVSAGDRRYPVTTQDSMRDRSHSVVERLTHTFGDWLKHRRELKEKRQVHP